jgi:hypothetical protein
VLNKRPGLESPFAFGRQQKALESLFAPPPSLRTLLKWVTLRSTVTHLMSNYTWQLNSWHVWHIYQVCHAWYVSHCDTLWHYRTKKKRKKSKKIGSLVEKGGSDNRIWCHNELVLEWISGHRKSVNCANERNTFCLIECPFCITILWSKVMFIRCLYTQLFIWNVCDAHSPKNFV